MIRLRDITLPFDHKPEALSASIVKKLGIGRGDLLEVVVIRKSIDARRKSRIVCVYTADVRVADEDRLLATFAEDSKISASVVSDYQLPAGRHYSGPPPVVVGSGPCGLFAALMLARLGARPILIERGRDVVSRVRDVQAFWREGVLSPE